MSKNLELWRENLITLARTFHADRVHDDMDNCPRYTIFHSDRFPRVVL